MDNKDHLNARFGSFLSVKGASALLGKTPEELDVLVSKSRLLRVTTADGVHVFPEFQFDEDDKVNVHIENLLLKLLPVAPDAWTVLYWLTSPIFATDGYPRLFEAILAYDDSVAKEIDELASNDAARWSLI